MKSLFTADVIVEYFPSGKGKYEYQPRLATYSGYRQAYKAAMKLLSAKNPFNVAVFYTEEGKFLKEIGLKPYQEAIIRGPKKFLNTKPRY